MYAVSASNSLLSNGSAAAFWSASAAHHDALFEIDRTILLRHHGRIARGYALHAFCRVAVAVGARLMGVARFGVPQRFAVEHDQHGRIGGVVALHGAGVGADEVAVGAALIQGNVRGARDGRCRDDQRNDKRRAAHSTLIAAVCTCVAPCWSVQENAKVPLSVATVKKVM